VALLLARAVVVALLLVEEEEVVVVVLARAVAVGFLAAAQAGSRQRWEKRQVGRQGPAAMPAACRRWGRAQA
jgi:hypothetical protein